ncbi:hypothetical protein B0H13DRAFT_2372249 [Mycena leptocephala]|nr:hypothetical protein B0H13DRAFT_2372249 [Mycena leptocephala]
MEGTNDSNFNDLPSDDNDAEVPDHGAEKVIDDPVESGIAPPDTAYGSRPPEDDDSDDEDSGDDNEGEEGEGWDSEEGASDDEDDLFDDEGFLDI